MINYENMDSKYNIGQRLLNLRQNKGVTQKTVGDNIGISGDSYGKYEQCINKPSLENLKKLAIFFETTPEYILTGKKEEPATELHRLLQDFTPEMQEKLLKTFKEIIVIFKEKKN